MPVEREAGICLLGVFFSSLSILVNKKADHIHRGHRLFHELTLGLAFICFLSFQCLFFEIGFYVAQAVLEFAM